jgi:hypothetical protein
MIWYKSTPNGGTWGSFFNTNLTGGDPSCVKTGDHSYLIVFVGLQSSGRVDPGNSGSSADWLFPALCHDKIHLRISSLPSGPAVLTMINSAGQIALSKKIYGDTSVTVEDLPDGMYYCRLSVEGRCYCRKIMKQN